MWASISVDMRLLPHHRPLAKFSRFDPKLSIAIVFGAGSGFGHLSRHANVAKRKPFWGLF